MSADANGSKNQPRSQKITEKNWENISKKLIPFSVYMGAMDVSVLLTWYITGSKMA